MPITIFVQRRGVMPLLPCRATGEITTHYTIYFDGLFKGAYCSKCIDPYLALLRDFAPAIQIIDHRKERLYE